MTLTKAIEWAREVHQARIAHLEQILFNLDEGIKYNTFCHCGCRDPLSHALEEYRVTGVTICPWHKAKVTTEGVLASCKASIAALPDKPMTEEEIAKIIQRIVKMDFGSGITAHKTVQTLKANNVLYVED